MKTVERATLTLFFIGMVGLLATEIGTWRFPDDPQMAMLLSIRNLATAILFAVIYTSWPRKREP